MSVVLPRPFSAKKKIVPAELRAFLSAIDEPADILDAKKLLDRHVSLPRPCIDPEYCAAEPVELLKVLILSKMLAPASCAGPIAIGLDR